MSVKWFVAPKRVTSKVWESGIIRGLRGLVARNAKAIIPVVGPMVGLLIVQRLGVDLPVSVRDQLGAALVMYALIWLAPKNKPKAQPPIIG